MYLTNSLKNNAELKNSKQNKYCENKRVKIILQFQTIQGEEVYIFG